MKSYTIHPGDCLQTLRGMPDNSVDAVCTDPPYGLSQHKPEEVAECLRAWLNGEVYAPNGKGFMGKSWDAWVPGPEVWRECLRVLKPGGHVLAFAGTRSMDLMSMAIRLAGFELRDSIGYAHDGGGAPLMAWTFGSGFPKSHSIDKAIDREAGAVREKKQIAYSTNVLAQGIGVDRPWMREAEKNGFHTVDGDTPATEAARQWAGWGSALKPAFEPILLARKPLQGTLASNVLAWGTGGINVDACRVGTESTRRPTGNAPMNPSSGWNNNNMGNIIGGSDSGRWPANLIHDGSPEVLAGFPETGASKAALRGDVCDMRGGNYGNSQGSRKGTETMRGHNDNGGSAARFFYCAKASRADRDEGLEGFEEARHSAMGYERGLGCAGEGMFKDRNTLKRNAHPTVKPSSLMRYLVRLITPPGGVVLDPFMGSGSTGKACMLEGFDFVGCELDPEYVAIARARIEHAQKQAKPAQGELI